MIEDHAAVFDVLRGAKESLSKFIEVLLGKASSEGRLIYLGAGTSGRLGVLDASECPPTFQSPPGMIVGVIAGGDTALRKSSEGMEDDPHGAQAALDQLKLTERDTILGIAAGGTTPFVLGGIQIAHQRGAMTGLLTCAPPPEPIPHCDHLIVLDTGPEILTGSTRLKAGTATKIALNLITTTLFTRLGKVYENLMVDLRATNNKLTDRAIRTLMTLCPELDRPTAASLLTAANGQLKTAIVMQKRHLSREAALTRLASAHGKLRQALND